MLSIIRSVLSSSACIPILSLLTDRDTNCLTVGNCSRDLASRVTYSHRKVGSFPLRHSLSVRFLRFEESSVRRQIDGRTMSSVFEAVISFIMSYTHQASLSEGRRIKSEYKHFLTQNVYGYYMTTNASPYAYL